MLSNTTTLIGNLGRDLEIRTTQTGATVATTSIACTRYYRGADGESKEDTNWFRLVIWGKTALNMAEFAGKGSKVLVSGRLQSRSYQDKNDQRKDIVEVVVQAFEIFSRTPSTANTANSTGGMVVNEVVNNTPELETEEAPLPF